MQLMNFESTLSPNFGSGRSCCSDFVILPAIVFPSAHLPLIATLFTVVRTLLVGGGSLDCDYLLVFTCPFSFRTWIDPAFYRQHPMCQENHEQRGIERQEDLALDHPEQGRWNALAGCVLRHRCMQ